MGRAKIAMEYIKNARKRNLTFNKRKTGLMKKAYELSTLCDTPVCVVVFPEDPDTQPLTYPENRDQARSIIDRYFFADEQSDKRSLGLEAMIRANKKRKTIGNSVFPQFGGANFPNWVQDDGIQGSVSSIGGVNFPDLWQGIEIQDHRMMIENSVSAMNGVNFPDLVQDVDYPNSVSTINGVNYPNLMPDLDGLNREQLVNLGSVLDRKLMAAQERMRIFGMVYPN